MTRVVHDVAATPGLTERRFLDAGGQAFAFLGSWGFAGPHMLRTAAEWALDYRRPGTVIRVSLDRREQDVFVYVIWTLAGKIPEYLDAPNQWEYLEAVISAIEGRPAREIRRDLVVEGDPLRSVTGYAGLLRRTGREAFDHALIKGRLTPREIEVLSLVAEGRSNADISSTLTISPKTVASHVAHAIAKLGVPKVADAAHLVREATETG